MTNEFDLTPKSASPYASSAYAVPYIPPPPNGTSSPVNIGTFGESPTVAGVGDGVKALTPEKELLNIINSKLGTAYENIEEAENAVNGLSDDIKNNKDLKALVAEYKAAGDETKKKEALDKYEKANGVSGIPSFSMPDFSAAGVPGVSLSPNLPGTPGFQYPGAGDPLSAIPPALQGLSGIVTAFNPNGSQTAGAGAAGSTGGASASANIPVSYADKLREAKAAEDIKWGTPQTVTGITTDTAAKVNEPIDAVSANFNSEDGSYVLNSNEADKQKQQVTDDMGRIDTAIDATNADAKNTYLSDGNDAAKELFKDGKDKTDEVHGTPDSGSPKAVVDSTPKGKIPEAQKAEYLKVKNKYGLEEDDAENKGKVNKKYSSETKKDDVESAVSDKYGKEEDNVGVLQGKLDYLAGVEQGAQADHTKFQGEMTRAEQAKNIAIQNGRAAAASGQDTTYWQNQATQAEDKRAKAEEKMKERKEVLDAAKEKKQDIESKLKASAEARTKELTAIKSGTNDKVKSAIIEKQTKADAVQNAVNAIVNKVQNGITDATENEVANFANMEAPDASLFNKDAIDIVNKFNGEVATLKSATEAKLAQLKKTKEMLGKILDELRKEATAKKDENIKIETDKSDSDGKKQKVTITDQPFDLSGAKAEVPEGAEKKLTQAQTRMGNSTGIGYTPGDRYTVQG